MGELKTRVDETVSGAAAGTKGVLKGMAQERLDPNNDVDNARVFVVQAAQMTGDVLADVLNEFAQGRAKSGGKVRYGKLSKKGKLDNIEITENNIKDFESTARKYGVEYALKRDKTTDPPTYYVYFTSASGDKMNKAFKEYATKKSKSIAAKRQTLDPNTIEKSAAAIKAQESQRDKEKNLSKGEKSR